MPLVSHTHFLVKHKKIQMKVTNQKTAISMMTTSYSRNFMYYKFRESLNYAHI